ncbi:MAG: hypothetical protein ACR2RB_01615 [Gammaproteobacteria bacterium]
MSRWRSALAARDSVRNGVAAAYEAKLLAFVARRDSALGALARAPSL